MRSAAWPREDPARSWKLLLDPSLTSLVLPKCLPHISASTRSILGHTWGCCPCPAAVGLFPFAPRPALDARFNLLFGQEKGFP